MRLDIAAIGRLKQGLERDLAGRYAKRASDAGRGVGLRPIEIVEIRESRSRDGPTRVTEESIALAEVVSNGAAVVVLDARGDNLSSEALAGRLRSWRDAGRPSATFLIGGPDGLAETLLERADLVLAFGSATWPHQLVRIMLLEQLYRVITILAGHPYHRE
jgi:23S rRNA (pseudouridine1915-N3)-methyltransferase